MMTQIMGRTAFAAALLLAGTAHAQSGPQIEWRVKDRFRLFDRANVEAKARVALLSDALAVEPGKPLREFYATYLTALSGQDGARSHSASLRTSNYRPAGKEPGRTSGRYAGDYLFPERYFIELRIAGMGEATCTYTSGLETRSGACDEWTSLAVAEGRAVSRADWRVATVVQVAAGAGQPVAVPIAFRDELVVALGDSYISGEGNPDVPSVITDRRDDIFERPSWGDKVKPGRDLLREAQWWDEPCHRSLLSWPVLASFAHAARDPHRAVTLVHLGCSGAIARDLYQNGETELPGGGDERESQLALLDTLRQRPSAEWGERKPDRILLSIGGNDIGFVGVLTALSLPPNGYSLGAAIARAVGKNGGAVCPLDDTTKPLKRLCVTQRSAQARLRELPGEYDKLAKAMPKAPVYQTIYPNPLLGEGNQPCDTNPKNGPEPWQGERDKSSGFEALMGLLPRYVRGPRSSWGFELRYDGELTRKGRNNADCYANAAGDHSEVCQALWVLAELNRTIEKSRTGWVRLTAHADKIAGHGLCRRSGGYPLGIPLIQGKWWTKEKHVNPGETHIHTPQSVDPYAGDNPRWFRTPNDSIVTQFGFYDGKPRFHHGTVHPTFRAHIEFAQAAYDTAFGNGGAAAAP